MPSPSATGRRSIAVVTGASGGVGRACAIELARRGYDVALVARGEDGLRATADDVLAHGGQALAIAADVGDWSAVERATAEVEQRLGPIDVGINNAMATVFGPVADVTAEEIHRATLTTYFGQVHGTLAALAVMRPRDRGTIVQVSSTLARRSIPLQAAYCGAKAAARAFSEAVRTELLHDGSRVRISQVVLPAVNTPQFGWSRSTMPLAPRPVAPVYSPERAARAIVGAARRAPRQRILGAWNRTVLALDAIAPGVLDHAAALGSWDGQQIDGVEVGRRAGNLDRPLDDAPGTDRGASGAFGREDGGVLDRAFLRSLPDEPRTLGRGAVARAREVLRWG